MRKLSLAIAAFSLMSVCAQAAPVPQATPPGITFQAVRGSGTVYADAHGMSLYVSDKDQMNVSTCAGDCANDWRPVSASTDIKAGGDWSIAARGDGVKQWAFKGKPLYTSAKDTQPGEVKGTAEGWHPAMFAPTLPEALPSDVAVHEAVTLPGQVLTNADGHTLYTGPLDCTGKCIETWLPAAAPAVANASGDFSAVKRRDGLRQWAYKGAPLYTYAGDIDDGDLKGRGIDTRFQVAELVKYFMPSGVSIRVDVNDPVHPAVLTAANGHTLYARERYAYTQTFHSKNGDRGTPAHGRAIGAKGCTGECLAHWAPLAAPANAVPSGHWTIVARDDGSQQWAYQGYALYTYLGDEKAGDTRGNELFDRWEKDLIGLPAPGVIATASIMYWRAAGP